MADQDFILAPATVRVSFAVMPVANIMTSFSIMCQSYELSGLGEWVTTTLKVLSPERWRKHSMIFEALHAATDISMTQPDYETYLDALAASDPSMLREKALKMYSEKLGLPAEEVLNDKERFLALIQEQYGPKYLEKGMTLDRQAYIDAFDLMHVPEQMVKVIHEHLSYMWYEHMKGEWKRVLPTLQEAVKAFDAMDYSGMTGYEAARAITGRDVPDYWAKLNVVDEVIFIPTAHIGPYVTLDIDEVAHKAYIMFGARIPRGATTRSSALTRSELLVRLIALTDETRLMILELLTTHEELCAQDIMTMLDLSQSSASRHLRQLTATGYLTERRRDVAKCYALNVERVDDTMQALKLFLRKRI